MKKVAASLIILFFTANSLASCNLFKQKKKTQKATSKTSVVRTNKKIKSLLMGRSGCFGQCPTYTIEIFESGVLRYTGKDYVAMKGTFEKQVSEESVQEFFTKFNTIQPDTLHYQYQSMVADLPGIYYFITYPDTVRKVINADAGPIQLREWATRIDEFAQIDSTWVMVKAPKYD